MPSLSAARAANARFSPSYVPVAVFVGGTAGIGKAIAQAFARHTRGNAHIVLVGRNKAAADAVIASFPKPPDIASDANSSTSETRAKHEFVACDATLMKNVDATTSLLRARLPKLNYLVMSAGIFNLKGRDETEEGIDKRMALEYYARWKFTRDLAPLLQRARDAGEDGKVMTVLSAGSGQPVDETDFALKNNYGLMREAAVVGTYNDAMVMVRLGFVDVQMRRMLTTPLLYGQSFAERYPDASFIHVHPGLVRTQMLQNSHWAWWAVYPLLNAVLYPCSVSEEEAGELLLNGMLQTGKGSARLNWKGDDIGDKGLHAGSADMRRRLWEHTEETMTAALGGSRRGPESS